MYSLCHDAGLTIEFQRRMRLTQRSHSGGSSAREREGCIAIQEENVVLARRIGERLLKFGHSGICNPTSNQQPRR